MRAGGKMETMLAVETMQAVETKGLQAKVAFKLHNLEIPKIQNAPSALKDCQYGFHFVGFFFPLPRGQTMRAGTLKAKSISVALISKPVGDKKLRHQNNYSTECSIV